MTDGDATVRNDEPLDPGGLSEESLQQEIEKALGDMSLMEIEDRHAQRRQAGGEDLRTGKVVSIVSEDILVDLGGHQERWNRPGSGDRPANCRCPRRSRDRHELLRRRRGIHSLYSSRGT